MQEFEGKVAVVTGAASGMGRAFAERFAEEGMKVVLSDVEEPALDAAVAELRQRELEVTAVVANVAEALSKSGPQKWPAGGVAVYEANAAHGPFVHIDSRGYRARWGR